MSNAILCVDDEENVLAGFQRALRNRFSIDVALGGEEALAKMDPGAPYAVIVADMQMPGMNGIEFLLKAQAKSPDTVCMMLTGNADQKTAVEAVNQGHVYRFLNKPCSAETLASALEAGLRQYRLVTAERELLEKTLAGSVHLLTDVLAVVDPGAYGRGQTLREQMRAILQALSGRSSWECELAASLASVGCVIVPPSVLQRSRQHAALTADESQMLQSIPEAGSRLVAHIPRLEGVARIILYQHKNFDGSGFPQDDVGGKDIPAGARILKVLQDLMRMEAKALPRSEALETMQHCSGWYDPSVLAAVRNCFEHAGTATELLRKPRSVRLSELAPGQVLYADVMTPTGLMVIPAGQKITPAMLELLRNFGRLGEIIEPIKIES